MQLVKATLHLSTHVLVGDHSQLASQLIGRLLGVADPGIHALLKQVEEKAIPPWLRPLTASFTGPGSQLIRIFHAPKVDVTAIAITADRQCAIAAFKNGTLSVLDLEYGRTVHTLEGYTDRASSVAITPDGRQAVFESIDQTVYVWDLENGNTTRVLHLPTEVLTRILLTPDGRYAVLASEDGSFQVWDLESRQTMRALKGPSHWKGAVAITRDVCRGFSVSGLDLQIWDLERGLLLHTFNTSTPKGWAAIEAVALTPDGRCAVSASADDTFRVWDLERPQMVRMFKGRTNPMIHAVAITSDGR